MEKKIGFFGIFSISAGAMISSGLFVLPGLAYAKAGPVVFLAYFLAGCIVLTTVLSMTELATAMPKGGGDYFYVSRTFGALLGTVSGILSWLALSLKSAFALFGLAELVYMAFGLNLRLTALILTICFVIINLLGVHEAIRFQIILVVALFSILLVFSIYGIQNIVLTRYEPFLSHGFNALFSTTGFVFVSFGGVLKTASIAGEIKNPSKNIPRGLIISTIVVTVLYTIVTFVVIGVVPKQQLEQTLTPVAQAAWSIGGPVMYFTILAASFLAFVTTANGGILTASRYPIALAYDGMLPKSLCRMSKANTPYAAIIVTGIMIGMAVLIKLDMLIKAASTVILLANIFAHMSVIVMRESKVSNYQPTFKSPFYPWMQIFGIIIFSLLIVDMGIEPILLSMVFIFSGVILYFIRRGHGELLTPAVVHLVERITNRKLGTHHLSNELRTIIKDRDGIIEDEFDKVIASAPLIEIDSEIDFNQFLEHVSPVINQSFPSIEKTEIAHLLRQRESESSTVISDFVAIPHIVIEGTSAFRLFLVRAPKGISFSHDNSAVKAVFLLCGSRDMRNLHLRALAAIAYVVQNKEFDKRWISARDAIGIKDIFFLNSRKRFSEK